MKQKYEKQVFKTSNTEQSLVYNPSNAVKKKQSLNAPTVYEHCEIIPVINLRHKVICHLFYTNVVSWRKDNGLGQFIDNGQYKMFQFYIETFNT